MLSSLLSGEQKQDYALISAISSIPLKLLQEETAVQLGVPIRIWLLSISSLFHPFQSIYLFIYLWLFLFFLLFCLVFPRYFHSTLLSFLLSLSLSLSSLLDIMSSDSSRWELESKQITAQP